MVITTRICRDKLITRPTPSDNGGLLLLFLSVLFAVISFRHYIIVVSFTTTIIWQVGRRAAISNVVGSVPVRVHCSRRTYHSASVGPCLLLPFTMAGLKGEHCCCYRLHSIVICPFLVFALGFKYIAGR